MKKKLVMAIIFIVALAYIGYNYIYQDHRNIDTETVVYDIRSSDLVGEFLKNQTLAESKYLNKTLLVSGTVSEINTSDLTLDDLIFCSFNTEKKLNSLKNKTSISIKGRCIGYDELLEQLKLDQCSIQD